MKYGIVIAHNNRCLFVKHGDHRWSRWSVDQLKWKWNRNKILKNIKERCLLVVLNDYLSNYSKLPQSSASVLMETQLLCGTDYEVLRTLNDLNPNFIKEKFYRSPNLTHKKGNLYVYTRNKITFGSKSLGHFKHSYGAHCLKTLTNY